MGKKNKNIESSFWLRVIGIVLVVAALGLFLYLVTGQGGIGDFFKKFGEVNIILLIIMGLVLISGVILLIVFRKEPQPTAKKKWDTRAIIVAALCIALSFVLSYIRIWKMPMGGSVTPASMLPIMLFSYIYGIRKGIVVGLAYSILQFIQDPQYLNFVQFTMDYIFGFGVLGLTGIFKKNIIPGVITGGLFRFLCSFISGVAFYGEYAEGMSPFLYSLGYNASYMIPEIVICVLIVLIPTMQKTIEQLKAQHQTPKVVSI